MSIVHLESRINQIYDHLYANAPVRTPAAIAKEVGKILRTIAYVENTNKDKLILFASLNKNKFDKGDKQSIKDLANFIRETFRKINAKFKYYEAESEINLNDIDIAFTCGRLSDIPISTIQRDVFGDAMEIFRSHWAKSNGGQFFTDQRVARLAIKLLQFNPLKGDDLVDICSGTGGFLIAALNHIKKSVNENKEKIRKLAQKSLLGQEIDKELTGIANSTLASHLGINNTEIVSVGDSILPSAFNKNKISFNSHYCLATNPPFGTKITIKDAEVLSAYDLAKTHTRMGSFGEEAKIVQRSPDILFIEQNMKLLKPGAGRLAIVVPYQIVSGPQTLFVRQWILKQAQVMAVIDLPPETFQPHTGTKASLLILKRRKTPLEKIDLSRDDKIFMATPKWIGHDRRGNPTYKRAGDGAITDEILTDFPLIEGAYDNFLQGRDLNEVYPLNFVVLPESIEKDIYLRLDARYYREHRSNQLIPNKRADKKDWVISKLKEVSSRIFYPGRFIRNYVGQEQDSIPFLGGTNISQLLLRTEKRIGDSPKINELKIKPGWILVTRSGSVGIVSTVPTAWDGFAASEHVIRIIPNSEKVAPEYIYAFLKTKYAQDVIARGVYGSVIDEITPEYLGNIEIPIPKDKKILDRIVHLIKTGEEDRQNAITSLSQGINLLEKTLIL